MSRWNDWLDSALDALDERDLLRSLEPLEPIDAVHVESRGRALTLFSSNDYLGLSHHPEVKKAASQAARDVGLGPRGSPLICGYTTAHEALERELAALKESQAALLFPTGFAANMAVISSLGGPEVTIYSDSLNHASIIDGCRLARRRGARLEVYPHRDVAALAELMEQCETERQIIVTDTVFSMDGDVAPLDDLAALKAQHEALLVVDEAHGTLVFGDNGGGVAEHFGVADAVDVHVGTMSKAVGALGGFACTTHKLREWIFNRGRAFVFSTAQPVPVVEAARAAIRVAREQPEIRRRVWRHVDALGERLDRTFTSPIVPVVLGEEARALGASQTLLEAGYHVTAIRPPTVPAGTSRLRVALSAAHTDEDVSALGDQLAALLDA